MKKKRSHWFLKTLLLIIGIAVWSAVFSRLSFDFPQTMLAVFCGTAFFSLLSAMLFHKSSKRIAKEIKAEQQASQPRPAPEPVNNESTYSPEITAIIEEGTRAQQALGHLYASIPDLSVKHKIRDIMEITDKIVEDAKEDPSDVPQIQHFLNYYIPTTLKLLNAYDRMGEQGIAGENISGTMKSIEEMLDTAIASYRKMLDSLFANQALDIETDIEVMKTLLRREGLSESDFKL